MKKFLLTTLIMIAGLFTLAAGARAETGTVVVHINEDFVAGGATLPAGTYKVYQDLPATGQTLILRGEKGSVFLIPSTRDQAFPGQLKVKLTRAGDVYYLSEVATDLGVYTFPAPRALTRTAKVKDQDLRPASGAN
jgi:hypothetical protein